MFLNNSDKLEVQPLTELRHDLLLNSSEESLFQGTDRSRTNVDIGLPYPITRPLKRSEDAVTKIILEKSEYVKTLDIKKKGFKYDEKEIFQESYAGHEYINFPKHLLKFYMKDDPDRFFNCDYNFYYTGGVLEHIKLDGQDYLIRPDVNNNLCATNISIHGSIEKLFYCVPSLIYNINSMQNDRDIFLVVREKHRIDVVHLEDLSSPHSICSFNYQVPVLDAKMNTYGLHSLGVVSFDEFQMKDIETNKTFFSLKSKSGSDSDNFQQFQFLNENIILLMNRYNIKFLDCRNQKEETVFDPKVIDCNSLCNFNTLNNDLLLATRHYLMKTDIRYLTQTFHYSHSLNVPPCYMDFTKDGDDTYLCLSGQNVDSKVMFTGRVPYSLPTKIPSIQQTLKQCRLLNPSLVLKDYLDKRLDYSITGIKILNMDGEKFIFTTNCLGEIFEQAVSDEKQDYKRPLDGLCDWIDQLRETEQPLFLTHVEEMSKARFTLNNCPNENRLKKYRKRGTGEIFLADFEDTYSKENMKSLLARDFLDVWDDEAEHEDIIENGFPEIPGHEKVQDWIETTVFSDDEDVKAFLDMVDSQK